MIAPLGSLVARWLGRSIATTAVSAKTLWKSTPGLSQVASKVWTGVGGVANATFGKLGPMLKDKSFVLSAIYIAASELGLSLDSAEADQAATRIASTADPESALLDLIHAMLVGTDLSPLDGEDSEGRKVESFANDLAKHQGNAATLKAAMRLTGLNIEDFLRVRQALLMDSDEINIATRLL